MTANRVVVFCATCARGARTFGIRYQEFLLAPATLFTIASGMLLIAASIQQPLGLFSGREQPGESAPLYLAAALVGSVYIWWSALQGIRRRDFTADIPVSIATIAAILIGQYSAAAVVAVLLLLGGMLENFVAARAGRALDALASLLPDRFCVQAQPEYNSGAVDRARRSREAMRADPVPSGTYPDPEAVHRPTNQGHIPASHP